MNVYSYRLSPIRDYLSLNRDLFHKLVLEKLIQEEIHLVCWKAIINCHHLILSNLDEFINLSASSYPKQWN